MKDWILVLSYLVTPSPSEEPNCAPLPEDLYSGPGIGCISMPEVEDIVEPEPNELVLNVYLTKDACLTAAVRYADGEKLPDEIELMISGSKAVAFICRGPKE